MVDVYSKYVIELCACAVSGAAPKLRDDIDYEDFFVYCMEQKLDCMVYSVLAPMNVVKGRAEELFSYVDFKTIQLEAEQERYRGILTDRLENEGIDYLVLKGKTLAQLYPNTNFRRSSDIDILILDESRMKRVEEIMHEMGFSGECGMNTHDNYTLDERINFEIHRRLFDVKRRFYEPSKDMIGRLKRVDGSQHCYEMTTEDLYVFTVAHAAKHIRFSGIGIRFVIDIWLLLRKFGDTMDKDVLNQRLNEFGITEFEENIRLLVDKWFNGSECTNAAVDELEKFILSGGWNGNVGIRDAQSAYTVIRSSRSKTVARIKQYVNVIFLPYSNMQKIYPSLRGAPVLLPVYWVCRGIRSVFKRRENMRGAFEKIQQTDIGAAQEMSSFNQRVGLSEI